MLGAIFVHIFREFAQIFREFVEAFRDFARMRKDFARILRDFSQSFTKSTLLGVRLHPCTSASYTSVSIYNLVFFFYNLHWHDLSSQFLKSRVATKNTIEHRRALASGSCSKYLSWSTQYWLAATLFFFFNHSCPAVINGHASPSNTTKACFASAAELCSKRERKVKIKEKCLLLFLSCVIGEFQ